MTEDEALQAAAEELMRLKDSAGWKILMLQLEADADHARRQLGECDPFDTKQIMRLQNTIARLNWFADTLEILIHQGVETEDLIETED